MAKDLNNRPDLEKWVTANKRLKFKPTDKKHILIEFKGEKTSDIVTEANKFPGLISSFYIKSNIVSMVFFDKSLDELKKSKEDKVDLEIEEEVVVDTTTVKTGNEKIDSFLEDF